MSDTTNQIQTAVLDAVKQVQDLTLQAVTTFTETVSGFVPELPFADRLPEPKAVVEQFYGFAGELFELQKDYAYKLAGALTPAAAAAK